MSSNSQDYSEPSYTKSVDRAKFPFYIPNIDSKLVPQTQELLEKYSHVPREEQSAHVHRCRDLAWDIRAYPCTGVGAWLVPQLCKIPIYPDLLAKVKAGATLMDVGCFVGHDLRRLVYDGAPPEHLYGVDIISHWDVGFEMFRDRDRFGAHFIEADVMADTNEHLNKLKGACDVVSCLQVLHQWDWEGQVKAAKRLATFTKGVGGMVVGNQIGNPKAQSVALKPLEVPMWRHNPDSFKELWETVGKETGTEWHAQSWMRTFEDMGWSAKDGAWMEPGVGIIEFAVTRTK